jgi:hypothetical protein
VNRGNFSWEIYNNDLYMTEGASSLVFISIRGGIGIIAHNHLYHWGTSSSDINTEYRPHGAHMMNYRSTDGPGGSYSIWTERCDSGGTARRGCLGPGAIYSDSYCADDADCGGTAGQYTMCEYLDDKSGDGKGYPCRDQIGRGTSQALKPFLFWGNTIKFASSSAVPLQVNVLYGASDIVLNRDYCINDTTMPSSCNGITTTYTPYTYPHPLRGGADTTPPSAPSGLSVE